MNSELIIIKSNQQFKFEYLAFIVIIIIFWYFNIRTQDVLAVSMPVEKMKNISIFNGIKDF